MAANKKSRSVVNNLPEVQRRRVVDGILAGESLRSIAKSLGCSPMAIQRYKNAVVIPAIKQVQTIRSVALPATTPAVVVDQIKQQTSVTTDLIRTSPLVDRAESLWSRIDKALDESGPGTDNFGLHSGFINQAHKSLELLGRITGELTVATTPAVAVQIVMPAVPDHVTAETVDPFAHAVEIGIKRR